MMELLALVYRSVLVLFWPFWFHISFDMQCPGNYVNFTSHIHQNCRLNAPDGETHVKQCGSSV